MGEIMSDKTNKTNRAPSGSGSTASSANTNANTRVDYFLDKFKHLESLLEVFYDNDSGRYDSVVIRYENSKACGNLGDELKSIRHIRNLLQHNPKYNGNYIAVPSEDMIITLDKIIQQVEKPQMAIDYGVPEKYIYKATLSSSLMKVLKVMKERGFSHIPVIENRKLYGVISPYTILEFITEQGMQIITEETKVNAMKDYLAIEKHKNEYYRFMSQNATFTDADEAFEKRDSKKRRLVVIFITETGSPDEPLLAMLTPYSVVGK